MDQQEVKIPRERLTDVQTLTLLRIYQHSFAYSGTDKKIWTVGGATASNIKERTIESLTRRGFLEEERDQVGFKVSLTGKGKDAIRHLTSITPEVQHLRDKVRDLKSQVDLSKTTQKPVVNQPKVVPDQYTMVVSCPICGSPSEMTDQVLEGSTVRVDYTSKCGSRWSKRLERHKEVKELTFSCADFFGSNGTAVFGGLAVFKDRMDDELARPSDRGKIKDCVFGRWDKPTGPGTVKQAYGITLKMVSQDDRREHRVLDHIAGKKLRITVEVV